MSYNYNYYQDANYGGAPGLPYGPAPPAGFNVPSMPPANNTPYPQQNYAPYPPSNSGPYPPQNSGPYALSNNGPYPPQNNGHYPPSNHGQYMPNSGPYSPQNSGPYPLQNSGPYPPQNSGPYPPQNSGPYSPQNSGPYAPQNSGPYAPQSYGQFPSNSGPAPHGGPAVGPYGGSQYGGGPGIGGGVAPSAPPMEQPVHQPQSFHTPTPAPGAPTRPPPPAGGIYPTLSSVAHPAGATAAPAAVPLRQTHGTVLPFVGFNAESDGMALRKAMKGLGTDERAIIDILCKRSNSQRQELKKLFKTMFGRDLPQDLKSELSGKFEEVILGLMLTPAEYDAKHIRDAIKGAGTDDDALIEILCTRSNAEIEQIKTVYKTLYKSDMEKDLKSDTSGDFMRLVVALSAGGRMESQVVNVQRAKEDATALFKAGKARIGTDEATFTKIFCLQSHAQLCATFDEYRAIAGCTIEQTLDSELSGNFCKGLQTIVKVARNKPGYFAERLYLSMKGVGTNDRVLMRVVVTRCEVDMVQIKQEFQTKYHKTLDNFIDGDTSGDYKKALLALIR